MALLNKCKRIFALLILSNLIMLCNASVAYPGLIDFKQPDGSVVKIKLRGDESLKWAETEDGYTLLYDNVGNLVYAQLDDKGDLVPTDIVATDIAKRPIDVQRRLQATPKKLFYSESQRSMVNQLRQARTAQRSADGLQKAVSGSTKGLIILVDYPDCAFSKTKDDFNKLMNQLNYTEGGRYGSVRDFYQENSFGQFDITADIAGVYRLSNNRAYYGANTTAGANDIRPREMAEEAIKAADKDVNYSNYRFIHIIYAGRGEESGGGSDCIWAHSWTVNLSLDGTRIGYYSCSPELRAPADPYDTNTYITNIGVMCHEIAHVLGTQDFYDTDGGTNGSYDGTGMWDVMADGEWLAGGACPAHFNPYTKIYDFGWASPTVVSGRSQHKLYAKSKDGFVRINTATSNEYFLLEYRVQKGFDKEIPGHGLIIYRASEGLSKHSNNTINAGHKQQFYVVAANAKYSLPNSDATSYGVVNSYTAPFPGNNGVDEFTDTSVPSMKSWSGANTNLPITSIDEFMADGYVTFDVAAPFTYSSITPTAGTAESLSSITLKFPKAASINTSAGSITLKSSNGSYYGSNIAVSMSSDGKTATITSTPNNSRWVIGQTYTLSIPAGYFVADSNNRSYEAVSCSWTIVPETFTYLSVSPMEGEVQQIRDILISFPNEIMAANGGSMPTLNIVDADDNVVASVATYKTKDVKNNPALMATVSPAITALGNYRLVFPAGVLSNDQYGSMLNRAFEIEWDVVLPPVQVVSVTPVGSEAIDLNTVTITFNEQVTVNSAMANSTEEADKISLTTDDPGNYGKDVRVTISDDGLTATINFSPSYGQGWTVEKQYTLNVPNGYFIGASGGTNKTISRSWKIVPKRLLPVSVTPSEGEVGSLSKIVITFAKSIYTSGSIKDATINGNSIPSTSIKTSGSQIIVDLDPAITELGTYTFHLPTARVSDDQRFNSGTQNGDIYLTWEVVSMPATSVTLDKSVLDIEIGQTATLTATVLPLGASSGVQWTSSDDAVATVDQNGVVTAIGVGETFITATTTDGTNLFAACHVIVKAVQAKSLTLDKHEAELRLDETVKLTASILPVQAAGSIVLWSSSDTSVATVDANGVVTAVGIGEAVITAVAEGTDVKDTCVVSVVPTPGDANNDGIVTVTDIVVTASYILGDDVPGFVPSSVDLNDDGKVNVTDIVLLVNIILGGENPQQTMPRRVAQNVDSPNNLCIDDFEITAGETKQIAIKLENSDMFTAFQADIYLPEGLELCEEDGDYMVELSDRKRSDHVLTSAAQPDGSIRLLSYSLSLKEFTGNSGDLVYLTVKAAEDFLGAFNIVVDNIVFVQPDHAECSLPSIMAGVVGNKVDSIDEVDGQGPKVSTCGNSICIEGVPTGVEVRLYTTNGVLIRSEQSVDEPISLEVPAPGIYLLQLGNRTLKVAI
ncbi:MAG: M6 family metalloprotease domain-containing protein [Muribaculaceae bacterium]|nr:M6 family metalloprotease domain-containing protein [Muribaculaceae bacterium]